MKEGERAVSPVQIRNNWRDIQGTRYSSVKQYCFGDTWNENRILKEKGMLGTTETS